MIFVALLPWGITTIICMVIVRYCIIEMHHMRHPLLARRALVAATAAFFGLGMTGLVYDRTIFISLPASIGFVIGAIALAQHLHYASLPESASAPSGNVMSFTPAPVPPKKAA